MKALDDQFFQKLKDTIESLTEKGSCTRELIRKELKLSKHYDNIITFCFESGLFPEYEMKRRVGIRKKS